MRNWRWLLLAQNWQPAMSDSLPTDSRSESSHTRGPWRLEQTNRDQMHIFVTHTVGIKVLATLECGFKEPFESQQTANAILMLHAPDLLAALRACADRMAIAAAHGAKLAIDEPALIAAVEAIAKAEGQS